MAENSTCPIIPAPLSCSYSGNSIQLPTDRPLRFKLRSAPADIMALVDPWAARLRNELDPNPGGGPAAGNHNSSDVADVILRVVLDPDWHSNELSKNRLSPESYQLTIAGKNDSAGPEVEILATDHAGVRLALTSLSALIVDALRERSGVLACQCVIDAPRFAWRGLHLDVCRHFFDVGFIKKLLDLMALHKLNIFHWHLTEDQGWRLEVPTRPLLAEISAWRNESGEKVGGYYTAGEIREVVEYASSHGIQVVPEIELPGHCLSALAAYPELACQPRAFQVETEWGIFDDVFCAGNDDVFTFLEEVLAHVIELFPGDVVHIGGDECPKTRWQECAKCQRRMKSEGLRDADQLQSWFVTRIIRWLADNGKRGIGWDEILEGGLAPGAMVMSWRGASGGIEAAKMGHDVVMVPTDHCYFDYAQSEEPAEPGWHGINTLEDVFQFEPLATLNDEQAKHVVGGQGNLWTERMVTPANVEYMLSPRIAALAEVLWTYDARDWNHFQKTLPAHLARLDRLGYTSRHRSP